MGVRKRETERIERENHAFAKRLFDKKAILTKKGFDDDFKNHRKYQGQIAKMQNPNAMRAQSQYNRATAGGLSYGNINADPMQHFGRNTQNMGEEAPQEEEKVQE